MIEFYIKTNILCIIIIILFYIIKCINTFIITIKERTFHLTISRLFIALSYIFLLYKLITLNKERVGISRDLKQIYNVIKQSVLVIINKILYYNTFETIILLLIAFLLIIILLLLLIIYIKYVKISFQSIYIYICLDDRISCFFREKFFYTFDDINSYTSSVSRKFIKKYRSTYLYFILKKIYRYIDYGFSLATIVINWLVLLPIVLMLLFLVYDIIYNNWVLYNYYFIIVYYPIYNFIINILYFFTIGTILRISDRTVAMALYDEYECKAYELEWCKYIKNNGKPEEYEKRYGMLIY